MGSSQKQWRNGVSILRVVLRNHNAEIASLPIVNFLNSVLSPIFSICCGENFLTQFHVEPDTVQFRSRWIFKVRDYNN